MKKLIKDKDKAKRNKRGSARDRMVPMQLEPSLRRIFTLQTGKNENN